MHIRTLILSALIICLVAAATVCHAQQEYVIGEGDLLKITVYDNPDLTTEVRVGGDGQITFPLIGEVPVADKTATDAEKEITRRLEDGYIVNPHVSIFIEEYKSKKVSVLGEVAKPGIVTLRGASTLMEVISDAGGITANAGDTIYIQRKVAALESNPSTTSAQSAAAKGKDDITIVVDTKRLFEDGDVTANVPVQTGDSIYVPRASFVYVYGEVRNPGAYKITKGLTVLKAITLAGGFTPKSSDGRTKIIRKEGKSERKISANMDDFVLPDDIIFVPESFF